MTLRGLRALAGKTQADVSRATGIAQGDVSRLEQRATLDEFRLLTLARLVECLGGTLEVTAVLPAGRRFLLVGADDGDPDSARP